jgi:hypothetical protein
MPIKLADDAIRDARLLVAEFDREIDRAAKILRATKNEQLAKRLTGELSRLRCERARAQDDLIDMFQLGEMPPEIMPWA